MKDNFKEEMWNYRMESRDLWPGEHRVEVDRSIIYNRPEKSDIAKQDHSLMGRKEK